MKTIKLYFQLLLCSFLLASCQSVYIRHSNLHHLKTVTELRIKNSSTVKITTKPAGQSAGIAFKDTSLAYVACFDPKADSIKKGCLIFLENKKVVYFNGSYWIRRGGFDSTTYRYINHDLNF